MLLERYSATPDAATRLKLDYPRRAVPLVSPRDVVVRGQIGSGAFCTVFSVRVPSVVGAASSSSSSDVRRSFTFRGHRSATHEMKQALEAFVDCTHGRGGVGLEDSITSTSSDLTSSTTEDLDPTVSSSGSDQSNSSSKGRYVLKQLHPDFPVSKKGRKVAMEDFKLEAELLSKLPEHPNIIKLVAMSKGFLENPDDGFLVLERLQESLQQRLVSWKEQDKAQSKGGLGSRLFQRAQRRARLEASQRERIRSCAVGLSKAVQHLHHHNIIYRDMKPDNVGFAADGSVRLFDFGLARSCQAHRADKGNNNNNLTGDTGTPRYMAPEVALHQNYDLSVDVYSFALLLWEICSLEKPYLLGGKGEWFQAAVQRHKRPSLRPIASPAMKELIAVSWDRNPDVRPSFELVTYQLEVEAGKA